MTNIEFLEYMEKFCKENLGYFGLRKFEDVLETYKREVLNWA